MEPSLNQPLIFYHAYINDLQVLKTQNFVYIYITDFPAANPKKRVNTILMAPSFPFLSVLPLFLAIKSNTNSTAY